MNGNSSVHSPIHTNNTLIHTVQSHVYVHGMHAAAFLKLGGRRLTEPPPWNLWPSPLKKSPQYFPADASHPAYSSQQITYSPKSFWEDWCRYRQLTFQSRVCSTESDKGWISHVFPEVLCKIFRIRGRQCQHLLVGRERGKYPTETKQWSHQAFKYFMGHCKNMAPGLDVVWVYWASEDRFIATHRHTCIVL